jgi:alpha-beta hydrolase superfamily lysophospholipase
MDQAQLRPLSVLACDGVELRGYVVEPCGEACADVLLVHGVGDHARSGHYVRLATALAARGCRVAAFDLRGHGRSGGTRVFVRAWREYREDLTICLDEFRRSGPRPPLFLIGLSMGGLAVADFVLHGGGDARGAILCAAPLGSTGASPAKIALARLISRIFPSLQFDPGLDPGNITREAGALRQYLADPLVTLKVSARLGMELLRTVEVVRLRAAEIRLPLLLLHGSADTIAVPQGSVDFHRAVSSPDKTLRTYGGARHNLFLEPEAPQVFAEIADWILSRAR